MRILHISGSYPPMKCGVGDYLHSLVNALSTNSSLSLGVLTSTPADSSKSTNGVEIFPVVDNWGIHSLQKICKFIKDWSPDIIHIQYPTQGYGLNPGRMRSLSVALLPLIAFFCGKRVVQTWHEYSASTLRANFFFFLMALPPTQLIFIRPSLRQEANLFIRFIVRFRNYRVIKNASSIPVINFDSNRLTHARASYLQGQHRLIVFFGFIYPHKGAELLLQIANPETDSVVFAGGYDNTTEHMKHFMSQLNNKTWAGNAHLLGYLPATEISLLLSVADAVVLPFRETGGGEWNSSLHAAIAHKRYVITTSAKWHGYNRDQNVYYCKVDDIQEMKEALDKYQRFNIQQTIHPDFSEWDTIANAHFDFYTAIATSGNLR